MRILNIIEVEKRLRRALDDMQYLIEYEGGTLKSSSEVYEILKKAHYDLKGAYAEFHRLDITGFDRNWPLDTWGPAPKEYSPKLLTDKLKD